ncbi:MAG: UDP-N-acetylmuramoyl-L-alanyl-D-glutamate--2,6-diaminopimelate ligase [Roseovarius sp.]
MSGGQARTLAQLGLAATGAAQARVTGLAIDSRKVEEGTLFAALPGTRVHGAEFIEYALRMGASAILTDAEGARIAKDALDGARAALVVTEDARAALSCAAALWFGAQPEVMVAVTGTNGKTSVASFTRQIWQAMGLEAINVGTTGVEGSYAAPLAHTTPDAITLHKVLADAADAGVTHAAMEASSHGLDQRRLDGVQLLAAAFTNFSQDHLDYHHTFEAYWGAKAALFTRVLPEGGVAVINMDDERGAEMADLAEARGQDVLRVGRHNTAQLRLLSQRFNPTGQSLRFSWLDEIQQVDLPLIGGFQGENLLLAAGLAIGAGADAARVFQVLPEMETVRGRMQLAATRRSGAAVFVDFAHTPDAVATAIEALRPHVMGRLVAIIGAGGDRDPGKRPLMGQAAASHADLVIVTDDNPRSEDPGAIRAAVMEGCPEAANVGDRAEAILRGVDALGPGDALLILGKGHETGQTVGTDVLPFNDAEQASVAVMALDAAEAGEGA